MATNKVIYTKWTSVTGCTVLGKYCELGPFDWQKQYWDGEKWILDDHIGDVKDFIKSEGETIISEEEASWIRIK